MSTERFVRLTCDRCGATSEVASDGKDRDAPRLGWVRLNYASGGSFYKDLCAECCEQVRVALEKQE